jgi:GAF domain-containing protein
VPDSPTDVGAREGSLRRIAMLVAGGTSPEQLFAAVVEEVGRVFPDVHAALSRYESGGTMTTVAISERLADSFPVGRRWPLAGKNVSTVVSETGRSARIDSYADASGQLGVAMRERGLVSSVGAPVVVEGRLWGVMTLASTEQPLPADAEARLAAFTELVATAIANTEARAEVGRLVDEQAALRRVATLVARAVPPEDVFAAVVEEVGRLLPVEFANLGRCEPDGTITLLAAWGRTNPVFPVGARLKLEGKNATTLVAETGIAARIESYADASGPIGAATRETGVRSAVGTPITVEGHLWGVMAAGWSREEPMPADTEPRLAQFTGLLETAIANAERRAALARLAKEQAALRRVATLVARGAPAEEVFAAVANEVGKLLSVDMANVLRYESDSTVTFVAAARERFPVGSRWPLGETNLARLVLETGRAARLDNYADAAGALAEGIREEGIRSAVGTPIIVEGRLWGLMAAGSNQQQPLPPDTESRLASFTELVATAIANTEARTEVGRLVDEQAALRRVATLVAEGAAPSEVFETVTREVGVVCGADLARMERYESGDGVIGVAGWSRGGGPEVAVGTRFSLEGTSIAARVQETSRPARVDSFADAHGPIAQEAQGLGIRSSVGGPIVVDGRLWGVIAASSKSATPFPPDTESQIAAFTELVATAIANTEARTQVRRLADEQAALRRVATLVARGMPAAEVFSAVATELERHLEAQATTIARLEPDGTLTIVAGSGSSTEQMPMGTRLTLESDSVHGEAIRTGRAARVGDYSGVTGLMREVTQRTGIRCSVAVPIMVDGSLWGSMAAGTERPRFPADAEQRMAEFTELVATAISNVQAREDLAASRARIVAAADDERRRVVRDLHDGAQQRLVHTVITLKLAQRALQKEEKDLPVLLTEALDHADRATVELRELAHGILPAVLTRGGLRVGVDALASRMPVPVEIEVSVGRLPAAVEATAYFVVSEALTNVAKHARAGRASVAARVEDGALQVQVRDDGVGGARPDGNGLLGLADRLAVLDGQLTVENQVAGGTLVAANIPVLPPQRPELDSNQRPTP